MTPILLPFPDHPDAEYARSIVEMIVPISEAALQEEFLERAQKDGRYPDELRNPVVSRFPDTQRFRDPRTEIRAQLALAFHALHGDRGFHCDTVSKKQDPKRFEMEKLLHVDSRFSSVMLGEIVRRKKGPEPYILSPQDERIREVFADVAQAFSGTGLKAITLNEPPVSPVESPAARVLREALEYYQYILKEWDIL